MAFKDYYQILNVPRNAPSEEIRHSYHTLIKMFHPDRYDPIKEKNEYQKANDLIQEILEAYRVLSDPTKRKEYDAAFDGYGKNNSEPPPKSDEGQSRRENERNRERKNERLILHSILIPWGYQNQVKFKLLKTIIKNSIKISKNSLSPIGLLIIGNVCVWIGSLVLYAALGQFGAWTADSFLTLILAIVLLCFGFYRILSVINMFLLGTNYSIIINSEFIIEMTKIGILLIPISSIKDLDSTVDKQNRVTLILKTEINTFRIVLGDTKRATKVLDAITKSTSWHCATNFDAVRETFKNEINQPNFKKLVSISSTFIIVCLLFISCFLVINKVDTDRFKFAQQTNSLSSLRRYIVSNFPIKKYRQEATNLLSQKVQLEAAKLRSRINGTNHEAGVLLSNWVLEGDILAPKKIIVESTSKNEIPQNYENTLSYKFHQASIKPIQNEFMPSNLEEKESKIRNDIINFIKTNLDPDLIEFHSYSGDIQETGAHIIRIDYDIVPTFGSLYYRESDKGTPEQLRDYFPSINFNWRVYLINKTSNQDDVLYFSQMVSSPAEHFSYKVTGQNETGSVYAAMFESACSDFIVKLKQEFGQQ